MGRAWTTLVAALPSRAEELRRLDEAVRAPLALSTRVGVVGVAGGSGCSTVGGLLASVLSSRRDQRILLVNASRTARSALWHAGLTTPAPSTPADETARRAARRSDAATVGLVQTLGGLYCLDLAAPVPETGGAGSGSDGAGSGAEAGVRPADDSRWWEAVAPAGRFFDFVVTDWGVRDASTVGRVLSASTAVVVTTPADRTSLQRAVDLARTVEEAGVQVLLAVDDVRRERTAALGEMLRLLPVPAVALPYDRAHGAARPVGSHRLRASTTLAALRLAAAVVDVAGRRADTRGSAA
jgi:cellulose biosynthesis protein BcsQ